MLNTSLHNRNVKDPLSLEEFIAMCRGIDEGRDVPRELLEVLSQIVDLYSSCIAVRKFLRSKILSLLFLMIFFYRVFTSRLGPNRFNSQRMMLATFTTLSLTLIERGGY